MDIKLSQSLPMSSRLAMARRRYTDAFPREITTVQALRAYSSASSQACRVRGLDGDEGNQGVEPREILRVARVEGEPVGVGYGRDEQVGYA